ncbi:MAG: hypothetical protein AAGG50_08980 [Bacteroidota bacterium]
MFPLAFMGSLSVTPTATAQEIKIGGFIKASYYYDTQQLVAAREGDFLLYPAFATSADDEPNDTDNLLFFPFFSRLSFAIGDLPETLGAKTTGYLETDFFGPGNDTQNTLRIRRATVKLDWATHEVMAGMEWSPLFLSSWARTVATEAGAPFNPFARDMMIKLVLKPANFRITGLISQQRDAFQEIPFTPPGGATIPGVKQQQQAGLPGVMMGLEYVAEGGSTVGVNSYYKWIRPTLTSDRFSAGTLQAYANLITPGLEARGNLTFGGDLSDHLMTGGYVVIGDLAANNFEPLNTVAGWLDLQTTGPVSLGVFGGYSQNLGTAEDGIDPTTVQFVARGYGGTPIQNVWRVSPRLTYTSGKVRIGAEFQATGANYVVGDGLADVYDGALAPDGDTESVINLRGDLSIFLFF